jgi:menaquinone-dependent protoporphyrinogen oxidase
MKVLVAYETKYGATKAIAMRIGDVLELHGLDVDVVRGRVVGDISGYDAFVLGSAAYYGSWLREMTEVVQDYQDILRTRPVWLFSSGPLGTAKVDAQGRDVRTAAIPKTVTELTPLVAPRDHHVFFGALDKAKLALPDRLVASMPAFPGVEGDFRDWDDVTAWAESIAKALVPSPVLVPA